MAERIAIIGVGQTEFKSRWVEISQVEMINVAVKRALENASLTIKDIDAVVMGNMELFEGIYLPDMWMVEGSGAYLKSGMRVQSGGTTGSTVCTTVFDLAASGQFNAVLGIGYEKQDEGSSDSALRSIGEDTFYDIWTGGGVAVVPAAGQAEDMLKRGSVTEEQIARLRVKIAECAIRNPYAHLKKKFTVEEVMNSRYLVPPIRVLHMCPTSVGACAIVATPEEKAKKISPNPAWVADWVTWHEGLLGATGKLGTILAKGPRGFIWAAGVEATTRKLYKRNGITNPSKQFDVIECYEPSTWYEAAWYECIGLCERNDAGKLIDKGTTALNGLIPVNPSGGVVSTNAIGASAMLRIAEAAIQIRGEGGEHQVPKDVKTALAVTVGGDSYSTAVLLKKSLL